MNKDDDDRPLSTLVAQGWEIVGFASDGHTASGGMPLGSVLLRRQKAHKILNVRTKVFGGYAVKEFDL